jgi:nucleolar protein 4
VRNIPLIAEEGQLKERFEKYGPVKGVFLVTNKETGNPTGSAFVHFVKPESMELCLEEAQKELELKLLGEEEKEENASHTFLPPSKKQEKKARFKEDSEVAEASKPAISWQGWRLIVSRAVSRDEAQHQTRQARKEALKRKKDSRNLYLAREGRIRPGTPAAEGLLPGTMDLIEARYTMKKKKLKNHNFFVSKTRLCVHGISRDVDEERLRQIFLKPVKDHIAREGDPCGDWDTRATDRKGRKKGSDPTIRQVKVVRDETRRGASRGYGFVDFRHHEHALIALRRVNNNPTILGQDRRLFVEFAVDNMVKLNILQHKHDRWQDKAKGQAPERERRPEDTFVPAKGAMKKTDYQKLRKKLLNKGKKGTKKPAYMQTQAYQDMIVRWIRMKKKKQYGDNN